MRKAMNEKRLKATVRGRVQGVFFRAFTEKEAIKLCLKGYVKNTSEGNVEVVAEGTTEKLAQLLSRLREGPPASSVETVEHEYTEATGEYKVFSIRY